MLFHLSTTRQTYILSVRAQGFDCGIIYCNEITARLVVQELRIDSKFIHPLPMNKPILLHEVQVTFMDANHCPGAAIILFRLKSGKTYLHTGDFRFHPKMLEHTAMKLHLPATPAHRLDGVYLDTTYADPKYTFPTQHTAIEHTLGIVEKCIRQDKVLFLFGSYSIGKERLFMEVATKFQQKVCVSKDKMKIMSTFGWPEEQTRWLTTEPSASK